jgi:O-antigen/teichoic acid export membrane protein
VGDPDVIASRPPTRARRLLGSGTVMMLAGTVVAIVGAYGFQLLGGRVLGPVAFAPLTVLWSIQFLVMTVVMLPVEQLIIRRLELTGGRSARLRESAVPLAALIGGTAVCVTTAMAVLGARATGGGVGYVLAAGLLVAGYTVFAAARGYLAGRHRYRDYGIATAAEALVRLLLAAAVLLVTADGLGLAVVMVLAPLGVLLVRPFAPATGTVPHEPVDDEPAMDVMVGSTGGFLGPLVLANGAAQGLLGVGPLVGAGPVTVSAVFVTFLLFRAPLWVIQSVLARVLPPFTALARRGEHAALKVWALRLAAGGAALAAVAAPLGWWLGPTLVGILFGDRFTPTASLTALVAVGTAVAAMTAVSSQILVAVGRTWHVGLAWTLALAVAALAFVAPVAAADVRVGLAFLAGEITALVLVTAFAVGSGTDRFRRRRPVAGEGGRR